MYNRVIGIIALITLFASCKEGSSNKFTVTGTIKNGDAQVVYLEETPVATLQRLIRDSAVIGSDGKFTLRAETTEETIFNIRRGNDMFPFVSLINDANKVHVDVDFNASNDQIYTIDGSESSNTIKEYVLRSGNLMRNIYYSDRRLDSLSKNVPGDPSIQSLFQEREKMAVDLRTYTETSIRDAKNPALALFVLNTYQILANNPNLRIKAFNSDESLSMLNHLLQRFPKHEGLASVKTFFDSQVNKAGLVGKPAPEITLPDTEGNPVKLSSLRGKYVLVDFWASWCKPCRDENPNVVKAYDEYKDKNFTILGVSLDRSKEPWMRAIVADKLNWTHISDLQYWNSVVVPLYKIGGIPYNVLLDPDGVVIAENLRGPALSKKLGEVLN